MSSGFLGTIWASIAPSSGSSAAQQSSSASADLDSAAIGNNEDNDKQQDNGSNENTPTASAQDIQLNVPSFSLTEDATSVAPEDESKSNSSSIPTVRSGQQTPRSDPQQQSNLQKSSTNSGMLNVMMPPPPPPRVARSQDTPKSAQSSLRIPSTGPLPNRGPPANSQQRAGTTGSRGKVLLAPGHSPMDWAALAKSSNLSGVSGFQRITPSQMKQMNGRKGKPIWSSWQGKVYNITPYLPYHPGGEKELFKAAGRDGTKLFMDIHPWVNWEGMLSACLVGVLVSEEEQTESTLDAID